MKKLIVTLMTLYAVSNCTTGDKIVTTSTGDIRGITLPSPHSNVEAFLGVPFAEPPVGPLRFRKPVPKSPWEGTYDATSKAIACMQVLLSEIVGEDVPYFPNKDNFTEDCLYLNVWVPSFGETSELKPILVWIFGGGFVVGSANVDMYDGATFAARENIIVMNFNYRLGLFGMYSSFTEDAPGNMLFHDQILAIKWMKSNAKAFGGDPDRITVSGQSVGAFSISTFLLSPLTKNLFNRAIMESTSVLLPKWYEPDNTILRRTSHNFPDSVGCSNASFNVDSHPDRVVECLRNLSAEKILKAGSKLMMVTPMLHKLRIGDDFMPHDPNELYRSGQFQDVKSIVGINNDEGSMLVNMIFFTYTGLFGDVPKSISKNTAGRLTRLLAKTLNVDAPDESINFYMNFTDNGTWTTIEAMIKVLGEYGIACPTLFHADYVSLRNPVYLYKFSHHSSFSLFSNWIGAMHGEEIPYVFGTALAMGTTGFTPEEAKLSERVMDRWAAFVKTGNPNIPGEPEWPTYSFENPRYLNIDLKDEVDTAPLEHRCNLFRETYNTIINEDLIKTIKNKKT